MPGDVPDERTRYRAAVKSNTLNVLELFLLGSKELIGR